MDGYGVMPDLPNSHSPTLFRKPLVLDTKVPQLVFCHWTQFRVEKAKGVKYGPLMAKHYTFYFKGEGLRWCQHLPNEFRQGHDSHQSKSV